MKTIPIDDETDRPAHFGYPTYKPLLDCFVAAVKRLLNLPDDSSRCRAMQ